MSTPNRALAHGTGRRASVQRGVKKVPSIGPHPELSLGSPSPSGTFPTPASAQTARPRDGEEEKPNHRTLLRSPLLPLTPKAELLAPGSPGHSQPPRGSAWSQVRAVSRSWSSSPAPWIRAPEAKEIGTHSHLCPQALVLLIIISNKNLSSISNSFLP